ncbi:peptide/nickel transport system permease protein [Nitratireductor aquibiodomus]|uniref:Peptide/nickel transport system permease protein n=1 Tax=Nitratireductor aquibiodomus TaxID=204799 RepID=A0A1H4JCV8_9HYPH|nr:ABC transporter permease [Nitratireductor aquibiodomus]SEB44144.1 peptide/nickel transport system permease protein [Nitratireductor aquibiodomus]
MLLRGLSLTAQIVATFLGLLFVTFLIGRVMPIDPVLAVVGDQASEASYRAAYQEMGLDRPLYEQFFGYLTDIFSGDFGVSRVTSSPVLEDIARVFPATLEMATLATILGVGLGIPAGVIAATHAGRWPDFLLRVFSLLGFSIPIFWLGLMGLSLFYGQLGWVGGPGRLDIYYQNLVPQITGVLLIDSLITGNLEVFWNAVNHLILPVSVLAYHSMAYISRMTRSFMLEQLGQEYITTARVKGLSETRVVWRHALGNIKIPLITVISLSYATLLEGTVLTETVFSWPGLGLYITNALLAADMNAVLGGTIVVGIVFVGVNLLSDFLYRFVDPRAK